MTAVGEAVAGVSAAEFRQAMGHFATGVTVVTSVTPDGAPVGTTANAVTSLSLDPPLVLVCFDLASLTLQAIKGHGAFAVNVLAEPQRELSANFARRGFAAAWDGVRHLPGRTGSPRLHGVLAVLDCTVEQRLPGGDHEIVVGRVRAAEVSGAGAPLVYWQGRYGSLSSPASLSRAARKLAWIVGSGYPHQTIHDLREHERRHPICRSCPVCGSRARRIPAPATRAPGAGVVCLTVTAGAVTTSGDAQTVTVTLPGTWPCSW